MIWNLAVILATVGISSAAIAGGADIHGLVAEGNQAFAEGDYRAARDAYAAAEARLGDSPEVAYNLGVAHCKLGDHQAAIAAFGRALATRDRKLEAKIKFNLGNVAYAAALREKASPPTAIGFLKTAIRCYRDALELQPSDRDAQINLEIARVLLGERLDALARQQKRRQQERERTAEHQESAEEQEKVGPGGEQQPSAEDQPQDERPQQAEEGMTREKGEELLQAVRDRERQRCEQLARRRSSQRAPVAKDW
jgi:tetratricopeptide (TPR) repeat protein